MVRRSRLEIDLRRLLKKSEEILGIPPAETDPGEFWKRPLYVEALEERLAELKRINVCQPDEDDLADYSKRIKMLRGIVDAEKLPSASQRWIACEMLSPTGTSSNGRRGQRGSKTKELRLQATSRHAQEMRRELLGSPNSQNPAAGQKSLEADVDQVLKYHEKQQERAAQEMLALTHSLKQNFTLAGHLIRKDNETLEKSKQIAEKNTSNLAKNNDRLSDFVRRSCQYWMWIMLFAVCLTFLWMVVFIRMFPKKAYLLEASHHHVSTSSHASDHHHHHHAHRHPPTSQSSLPSILISD